MAADDESMFAAPDVRGDLRRWCSRAAAAAVGAVITPSLVLACSALRAMPNTGSAPRTPTHGLDTTRSELPKPVPAGTNRALAVSAAAQAFEHFPVPPRSTRVHAAPAGAHRLRRVAVYVAPVDTSLTRTGWWLVPLGHSRLVAWYAAHTSADIRSAYYFGATSPAPHASFDWSTHDASPAYSTPVDVVEYAQVSRHRTAIRTDVTLAARGDRTAKTLVPMSVTRIDITKQAIDGPDRSPRTVTVRDRSSILAVVAAFDSLKGDFASRGFGCGSPVGVVYTYAVTFHWPRHTLVADPGEPLCGVGRGLTRDARNLPQTLQDDGELTHALKSAFGSS